MAITAYVGSPGSGKSYSVVAHVILPAINQGRIVVTNIPINSHEFEESKRQLVKQFDIVQFASNKVYFEDCIIAGAVIVIDECWKWLPAGLASNKIQDHFKAFLAEHRHMVDSDGRSTDICLVTQDLSQLASFPRQLVEKTFRTTKLLGLGSRSRFRVDIYEGAVTGQSPPKSKLLSKSHLQSYKKEIYKFYKSHTQSDSSAQGALEVSADGRGSVFDSVVFKVMPVVLIIALFGAWKAYRYFKPEPKEVPPAVSVPVTPNQPTMPVTTALNHKIPVAAPVSPPVTYSQTKRLTGILSYADRKTGKSRFYVLVSVANSRSFRLPFMSGCRYVVPRQDRTIECDYQGEKISFFTGKSEEEYAISTRDLPKVSETTFTPG